jgi:hypothetical protein
MNFQKFSGIGLLLAGAAFLTVPLVAQQEVDPDHFDAHASQNQKPALHQRKAGSVQSKNTAMNRGSAPKDKSELRQVSVVVKGDPATVPVDSKH